MAAAETMLERVRQLTQAAAAAVQVQTTPVMVLVLALVVQA
jgi:hypothetical protein